MPAEHMELGARILDKAGMAQKTYNIQYTDFLDPGQQLIGKDIINRIPGLECILNGGFENAERKRMLISPADLNEVNAGDGICCLKVVGNFRFQKVSHRDFMGAILNCGVRREKIGDITVTETGCQVVVASEIRDYIVNNLNRIHRVSVTINEIEPEQLKQPIDDLKELGATVSSLRLDAVASVCFGVSRSKIVSYITGEKTKVNWEIRTNPDFNLNEGDVISIRGLGRAKLTKINGTTKKGRISIIIGRYV